MWYLFFVGAIVVFDQVVKQLVALQMDVYDSVPIVDGFFHITYVQNTGAAFSILQNQRFLLVIVPTLVIVLGIIYIIRHKRDKRRFLLFGISLIVAGGIGNIIDRIRMSYVIDMFDFRVFPVFNVADIAVCIGCLLFAYHILFLDKKRHG